MTDKPCYAPVLLNSMTQICKAFSVGAATVQRWIGAGAPIAVDTGNRPGVKRYYCEMMRLYTWLEESGKRRV